MTVITREVCLPFKGMQQYGIEPLEYSSSDFIAGVAHMICRDGDAVCGFSQSFLVPSDQFKQDRNLRNLLKCSDCFL